jgi:serine/threonine protein phosphatase PrpC
MQTANFKNYHYTNRASSREPGVGVGNPLNGNLTNRIAQPQNIRNNYQPLDNKIFADYMKPNLSGLNINSKLPSQQERVITFGQDYNENNFKRTLRKPILQSNSLNVLGNTNSFNHFFNTKSYTQVKSNDPRIAGPGRDKGVESIFYNYDTGLQNFQGNSNTKLNNLITETPKRSEIAYGGSVAPVMPIVSKEIEKPQPIVRDGENGFYAPECISIKEYAYRQDPNIRFRPAMEDFSKCIDVFNNDKEKGFFSIYDGHGGSDVVKYVKDRMPDIVQKQMLSSTNEELNFEKILINSFHKMDEELKVNVHLADYMGCTASVCIINKEKDLTNTNNYSKVIYTANVGDSRVVLVSNTGAKRLSYDHKASDYSEVNRIRSCGGIIFNDRVFGQLILTRALGDLSLKRQGVIPTPYVSKYYVSEKDKYLIMASDGVWDVLSDEDMFLFSKAVRNSDDFAKILVNNSIMRGSRDNISVLVIKLN